MTKIKRIMAVLMSAMLVFGSVSVSASAAYNPYLGSAITSQYNSIDKVDLTLGQKASILLDDLDVMLEKEDIYLDIPVIGTIDLTSIDAALDSIYSITGNWLFGSLTVGDLSVLEDYRANIASVRRTTEDKTDADVIASLVKYLANCAPTLLGMFGDDFNWGIVHGFLPPEFRMIIDDFNGWLDELIWDLLHPVNDEAMPENPTLDYFVQFLCDNQLAGKREEIMGFEGVMPGLEVNIESDTAYSVIEEGIYEALNAFVIPILNGDLKTTIQNAVDSNREDGGKLYELINVNYNIDRYEFNEDLGFVEQINDVFKVVVDKMLISGKSQWKTTAEGVTAGRSNVQNLIFNLETLLKQIIEAGGETEDVSGYNLKQLGDYIARVAVEQFVDHLDFEKGDSMEKIAYEGLRELVVRFVPEVTYADMPANTSSAQYREAIYEMGADIACYYLNANIALDCPVSTTAEEFISEFITWCMPYINGLFEPTDYNAATNGWQKIDAIIWQFIPKEWMNYADMFADENGAGTAADLTFKSLLDYIIDAVFEMDIEKLFIFFDHVENGALTQPVRTVIINFVAKILNTAFYVTDSSNNKTGIIDLTKITTFDSLVNPVSNAADIISGLLKSLDQRPDVQVTVINLVTMIMGLGDPQSLGELDIDLDSRIDCTSGSIPAGTKMRISNYSDGVNSGWTPAGAEEIVQDKMYEIELVSLTNYVNTKTDEDTPAATVTASVTQGTKIAANSYLDVNISGTVSANTEVRFDLEYYILDENGEKIGDTSLVKSVFTHLYKNQSDYYTATSAESSANNVTFEDFSTWFFTTDVYNASLFSILATNESGLITSAVDVKRAIVSGTLPTGLAANAPADGSIVHIDDSSATSDTYGTVNPYVSTITDPNAPQPYGIYNLNIQFEVQGSGLFGQTTTETSESRAHNIVIYNDFGLPGVLSDVMSENRQKSDYADAQTEWDTYIAALFAGYELLDGNPDQTKMFDDVNAELEGVQNDYYVKVEAIKAAVAALDAKAKPTDSAKLAALNAEIAKYASVDSDNYVLFTYDRFEEAYDRATSLADSQVAPEGDTTFVAPPITAFDLAYATQQLKLWGARLILKTADKTQLNNLIDKADDLIEAAYTPTSWAPFETALEAANTVKNSETALQTEVNDARIELMKKMNDLVEVTLLDTPTGKTTVIDDENLLIYGLTTGLTESDFRTYLTIASGYTITVTPYTGSVIGTGSTVAVKYNGVEVKTYTVIIYGDVDGDGEIYADIDGTLIMAYCSDPSSITNSAALVAADVDKNGTINMSDYELVMAENVTQTP